ncbi:vWA domain-containing protein [Bacillus cereus]
MMTNKKFKFAKLYFAALNLNKKPYTADKELTEEEKEAMMKQVEKDLKIAMREANALLSDDLVYLIRKQGFFASIAVDMKKVVTMEVPIAAVNVLNAISHLYINPITYPNLEKKERIAVLIHEILHLALFHVFRYLDLPDDEKHHYLWNLACDCAINQLIPNNNEIALPKGAIFPETFKQWGIDVPKGLSAEEYYEFLKDNQDKIPEDMNGGMDNEDGEGEGKDGNGSPNQNGGGNKQGKGKYKNWHKKWGETKGSKKINEAAVKNSVRKAYTREAGSIPGNLKRVIEEIIESKIPWTQMFSKYTAKYLKASYLTTFKRESRRLGALAKGRRQKRKLAVAIIADTSMSIGDENLAQFSGHIVKIWKSGVKVTVIEADAEITDVYEFKGKINRINYAGGGGTSFIPPFEYIQKERMEIDLVIYLTDGYGDAPEKFNIPTIWCLVPDGKKPSTPGGGEVKWGDVIKMN